MYLQNILPESEYLTMQPHQGTAHMTMDSHTWRSDEVRISAWKVLWVWLTFLNFHHLLLKPLRIVGFLQLIQRLFDPVVFTLPLGRPDQK
jgi:hypothetical protein